MSAKEQVVISGIGGTFPESENLDILKKNLFGGVDVITKGKKSFITDNPAAPNRTGRVPNASKFDAEFFGVDSSQCKSMDPMIRVLLEKAFEAVMDSGNNPIVLKGRNIGVYMATSIGETQIMGLSKPNLQNSETLLGCGRNMLANHVSYYMDLKGPSFTLDSQWIGGLEALSLASEHIREGSIDSAIVGVANMLCLPNVTAEFDGMNMLSADNKCRSFDGKANGYPRSEAVVCFFLQKITEAKRNYGAIVGVKAECVGARDCSFFDMSEQHITEALQRFYTECGVNPSDVAFVEADGCGVKKVENVELTSLSNVFCPGKESPLAIGSIKSNLGHTEASSALVGVTKALIAMDTGLIPATLHYTSNTDVPAVYNGNIKVVSEVEGLQGDLVAVNALSLNGGFGHALFRRNMKPKQEECKGSQLPEDGLPRLVLSSARHQEGMASINDAIRTMPLDTEFAALMNNVHKYNITGHKYRTYTVLPAGEDLLQETQECVDSKPQVWYVFSGLGSQYNGMGVGLMRFPVFSATVEKCHKILSPLGLDLKALLTSLDTSEFDSIPNCVVGVTVVQIGLVDLLSSLGITPDGIIGLSVGELASAYTDGCLTIEEAILSAHALGKALLDTPLVDGAMAVVGLGCNNLKERLPESIEVVCHSLQCCILSGPAEDLHSCVQVLTGEGIFTRTMNVGNIACHSQHIASAGPVLLELLKEVIQNPKARSAKWNSSCVLETDSAAYCSSEYFTRNLLSPVLFEDAWRQIPHNAVVVEISPQGILQELLQNTRPIVCVPLMDRNAECSVRFLLASVGKLYLNNLQPDVNAIYPPIEYPVSRGTAGIAQLVTWDHSRDWFFCNQSKAHIAHGVKYVNLSKYFAENQTVQGHKIHNNVVMTVAQLLIFVWETFSENGVAAGLLPVSFEEVQIFDQIVSSKSDEEYLGIMIQRGTGNYEVFVEGNTSDTVRVIMSGKISELDETYPEVEDASSSEAEELDILEEEEAKVVSAEELYSNLEWRGYQLSSYFRQFIEVKVLEKEHKGQIMWQNHWLPFLDAVFKVSEYFSLGAAQEVHITSFIQKITIDPTRFSSEKLGNVSFHKDCRTNILQCDGIKVFGAEIGKHNFTAGSILQLNVDRLELVPIFDHFNQLDPFLSTVLQLVCETHFLSWKDKVTELVLYKVGDEASLQISLAQFEKVVKAQNRIQVQSKVVSLEELRDLFLLNTTTPHLILINPKDLLSCMEQFNIDDPVYFYVQPVERLQEVDTLVPVIHNKLYNAALYKKSIISKGLNVFEPIEGPRWLWSLRNDVITIKNNERIVLAWKSVPEMEVIKICKALAKEDYVEKLCCFFLLDKNAPEFSVDDPFYKAQLTKGLAVSILDEGKWKVFQRIQMTGVQGDLAEETTLPAIRFAELDLHYLGINLQDNTREEKSNEQITTESVEYSGVSPDGQQLLGLALYNQPTLKLQPDDLLNWSVPAGWTLEEAATVPLAYATAYYALHLKAKLRKGETILVHPGYGSTAEAVVRVAMQLCADVFTTVSDEQQVSAMVKRFPDLKRKQIFESERHNFDLDLLMATKGKGVKVVVNSVCGMDLQTSLRCLANNGRFVQFGLGRTGLDKNQQIGTVPFLRSSAVFTVAADNVLNATDDRKTQIQSLVQEGIQKGVVKPLLRKVFAQSQSNIALDVLNNKDEQERVIIALKKTETSNNNKRKISFKCDPNKSYLILGTRHGLWLDLAEWLVDRGARNIVVAFNQKHTINSLNARRMDDLVTRCDATIIMSSAKKADSEIAAFDLLKEAVRMGPLDAIFNIYLEETSVKVKHVDAASRVLAPELSQFVCILGGDASVCEERKQAGRPALTVQCDVPLNRPKDVLKYLTQLLETQDTNAASQLVLVNDPAASCEINAEVDEENNMLPQYLPYPQELYELGSLILHKPQLTEMASLSPRMRYCKQGVKSVYMFPGLSRARVEPLVKKLHFPVLAVALPTVWKGLEKLAVEVVNEMLKVKNPGTFTLLSESWSGALAIRVGCILEARGHSVSLFLLDAAPEVAKRSVRTIGNPESPTFDEKFLKLLLNNLTDRTKAEMIKASTWEDKLDIALKCQDEEKRMQYTTSLTALRSVLVGLGVSQPSGKLFKGSVNLIRRKRATHLDLCELEMYCQKVKVWIVADASTHSQLITSNETAAIINSNANNFY